MEIEKQIGVIIAEAIDRQGGNKSEIGRKIGYSSQLLGQYARGEKEPKVAFFVQWKSAYNEDLYREIETKVYNLPSVEFNLALLLHGQNEIRAQLQTIHQWDAETYGGGDEAKEREAAEHIGMLYASNLLDYQKKGIRPLLGKQSKVVP